MIPGDHRRGDLRMSSEIPSAKSSPSMSFARRLRLLWAAWPTVLPLVCLVASWFALRRGFLGHADIPLWDETEYLASGWRLLHHAQIHTLLPGSPLYVIWYALWHLVAHDALVVLYGQWLLIDLLLAVSVYFIMRAGGANGLFAYLAAAYWSSLICMWDPPRVGFFALLLALLAALAEHRGKHTRAILLVVGAALSRPEYLLAVVLWLLLRSWPRMASRTRLVIATVTPVVLLLAVTGAIPGLGGERTWVAFAQHYTLRWAAEHPSLLNEPWLDWPQAVTVSFPGAHSIGGALLSNPHEVLHHVASNLLEYPGLLVTLLASPALPGRVVGPAILSGLLLAVAVRRRWPQPVTWHTSGLLLVACVSVLPSLLVKPKAVYALPLLLLTLIGMVRLARSLVGASVGEGNRLGLGACVAATLALWLVPPTPPVALPVAGTLSGLRAIWSQQSPSPNWRMLEADGGWCTYLDYEKCKAEWLQNVVAGTTFAEYLRETSANAILVSDNFRKYPGIRHDPEFARFERDPASFGFRLVLSNPRYAFFLRTSRD